MNNYKLSFVKSPSEIEIYLNTSKSESNRLLIIESLSDNQIQLENLSQANDTLLLKNLIRSNSQDIWDAEDAGTTMRFLTSFLALTQQGVLLTGTERMKKRPIKILVDALNKIGAQISYNEKDGYPPLMIDQKI